MSLAYIWHFSWQHAVTCHGNGIAVAKRHGNTSWQGYRDAMALATGYAMASAWLNSISSTLLLFEWPWSVPWHHGTIMDGPFHSTMKLPWALPWQHHETIPWRCPGVFHGMPRNNVPWNPMLLPWGCQWYACGTALWSTMTVRGSPLSAMKYHANAMVRPWRAMAACVS